MKHLVDDSVFLLITGAALYLWADAAWAEPAANVRSLRGELTALEDEAGAMEPATVWQRIQAGSGKSLETDSPDFGVTDSVYWVSIPVYRLDLDSLQEWVIEVAFARLGNVQYFAMNGSGAVLNQYQVSVETPLRDRPLYGRYYLFPLDNVDSVHSVLIRVQSSVPMQVPLSLQSRGASESARIHRDLALGIYFGLALIMVLYNLMIFAFTRETMYLMYSAVVASFVSLIFLQQGFGYYFFPDSWSSYYESAVFLGVVLPAVFIVAFVHLFLTCGAGIDLRPGY